MLSAMFRHVALALALVLVAGCTSAVPAGTSTPTPAATAATDPATAPPLADAPTITADEDGVLLEVWLPAEVAIGTRSFAAARMTNRTDADIYRQVGGCEPVAAISVDFSASVPAGPDHPGIAGRFKQRLLEDGGLGRGDYREPALMGPNVGCDDMFALQPLRPGAVVEQRYAWDPIARPGYPIVAGAASVAVSARYYSDENEGSEKKIERDAAMTLLGSAPAALSIADYADRAVAVPEFHHWLGSAPEDTWINAYVGHWPNEQGEYPPQPVYQNATEGTADVGLFRTTRDGEEAGIVVLDLPSGDLLGTRFEP